MDSADEFFFHNFLCDSEDEEMVVAVLVHDHVSRQWSLFRGSIPGTLPVLNRNRESVHFLHWNDYFEKPKPLFKHHQSGAVSVWLGMFSTVFERG